MSEERLIEAVTSWARKHGLLLSMAGSGRYISVVDKAYIPVRYEPDSALAVPADAHPNNLLAVSKEADDAYLQLFSLMRGLDTLGYRKETQRDDTARVLGSDFYVSGPKNRVILTRRQL